VRVTTDLSACPTPARGTVVTIGAFDGVHRGHRAVFATLRSHAERLGCETAVVTFDPHPATVVRPESAPKLLTSLEQRLELIAEAGVDQTVVIHFDEERSREPAADFVHEVLRDCLQAKAVVVGENFHFGRDREGTIDLLRKLGADLGFEVHPLPLVPRHDGVAEAVSSTAIRRALDGGDVALAARLLGRPFELRGTVVHGDGRGRRLGYPTANLAVAEDRRIPADAVYAGWYVLPDGTVRPAAISIGRRPTFAEHASTSVVEAHLLDFDGDLYGQEARLRFVALVRSQQKFDSPEALVDQLRHDVVVVRDLLADARSAATPT